MDRFDPEEYRRKWNELATLPSLVSAKVAATAYLSAKELEDYATAGYAPCVWINGKAWYRQSDVKQWIKSQVAEFQPGQNLHIPKLLKVVSYDCKLIKRPLCLAAISNLIELPIETGDYPPAVYFLCLLRDVVYVGQTTTLLQRIGQHSVDKVFDSVFFLPTPVEYLSQVEAGYIKEIEPIYNLTPMNQRDELNRQLQSRLDASKREQIEKCQKEIHEDA